MRLTNPQGLQGAPIILSDRSYAIVKEKTLDPGGIPFGGFIEPGTAGVRVTESSGTATVYVNRNGSANGAVSVVYETVSLFSAIDGVDYEATSGVLEWADGDATPKAVELTIYDDFDIEQTEIFSFQLRDPIGDAFVAANETIIHIVDDEVIQAPTAVGNVTRNLRVDEFAGAFPCSLCTIG